MSIVDSVKNALGIRPTKPTWKPGMSAAEESEYQAALLAWQHPELNKPTTARLSPTEVAEREQKGMADLYDKARNFTYDPQAGIPDADKDAALAIKLRPFLGAHLHQGVWETEKPSAFIARYCGWMNLRFVQSHTVDEIKEAIEAHSSRSYLGGRERNPETLTAQDRIKLAGLIGDGEPTQSVVNRLRLPLSFLRSATRATIEEALTQQIRTEYR